MAKKAQASKAGQVEAGEAKNRPYSTVREHPFPPIPPESSDAYNNYLHHDLRQAATDFKIRSQRRIMIYPQKSILKVPYI